MSCNILWQKNKILLLPLLGEQTHVGSQNKLAIIIEVGKCYLNIVCNIFLFNDHTVTSLTISIPSSRNFDLPG